MGLKSGAALEISLRRFFPAMMLATACSQLCLTPQLHRIGSAEIVLNLHKHQITGFELFDARMQEAFAKRTRNTPPDGRVVASMVAKATSSFNCVKVNVTYHILKFILRFCH